MRDRQAVQRADVASVGEILVGEPRARHRLLGDERDDRVDAGVDALDLREVRADDLARRQLLRADQTRELDRAQLTDVARHDEEVFACFARFAFKTGLPGSRARR